MENIYLKNFKIDKAPNSAFYIKDFISKEEEQDLLDKVIWLVDKRKNIYIIIILIIYVYRYIQFPNQDGSL